MKSTNLIIILFVVFAISFVTLGINGSLIVSGLYSIFVIQFKYKRDIAFELVIATFFALFISSLYPYEYIGSNYFLGPINLYPLVLWTLGLVLLRELYEYLGNKWLLTSILYILGLFILEYIGFHILGIRTIGDHPGVFGLDIIHGPPIIHYFYILAGPLYLFVSKLFKTP